MAQIILTGTLTCPPERAQSVRDALPEHLRLTRAEPGCITFDVQESAPGVFDVSERFASRAAFDAHQQHAGQSAWAEITRGCPRDYAICEA
ncbi:antibiotic biosynthesis monooxygenase [Salipiger sp. 1_MG-2023]|uniref:putative quinol monooxygenase n=1 Tax=Salipiger sp. 1_MG-2023 TaxID=3062665 RepID=UPI0026E121B6|nr:antibiotic biosynthesis monooxygenase [Salipiger sp. 1_MG-2023]MDO6585935.1 antibiotic biosynthesis monooxygenase [Salipiger sp. 1_MG-2023]